MRADVNSRSPYSRQSLQPSLFGPLAAGRGRQRLPCSEIRSSSRRQTAIGAPRLKWATYTSTRFIGGAAMGLAAQAVLATVPSDVRWADRRDAGRRTSLASFSKSRSRCLLGVVRGRSIAETAEPHKPLLAHLDPSGRSGVRTGSRICLRTRTSSSPRGLSRSSWSRRSPHSASTASTRNSDDSQTTYQLPTRHLSARTSSSLVH